MQAPAALALAGILLRADQNTAALRVCNAMALLLASLCADARAHLVAIANAAAEQPAADVPDAELADAMLAEQCMLRASAIVHVIAPDAPAGAAPEAHTLSHAEVVTKTVLDVLVPQATNSTPDISTVLHTAAAMQAAAARPDEPDAGAAKRRRTAATGEWHLTSAAAALLHVTSDATQDLALAANQALDERDAALAANEAHAAADAGDGALPHADLPPAARPAQLKQVDSDVAAACTATWQSLEELTRRFAQLCAAAAATGSTLVAGTQSFLRAAVFATHAAGRGVHSPL